MSAELSILVISYNTRQMTLDCLRSIFEQTKGIGFEVIVLDNASTDGSAQAICSTFPQVRLIASQENLGFARGNNIAAKEATGAFLLLLNPDTVVLDKAIERLHGFALERGDAQIFGGRTYNGKGELDPTSCWARPSVWSLFCLSMGLTAAFRRSRIFDPETYGPWNRDTVRQVDIVTGCFLLIRRAAWDRLGGFDSAFFMYAEETDLCLRAADLGYTCLFYPGASIVHYGGASDTIRADRGVRLLRTKVQLVRKHWSTTGAHLGVALLWLWPFTRMLAFGTMRLCRPGAESSYSAWRAIWSRRREWLAKE